MKALTLQEIDTFFRGALAYLNEKREEVNKLNVFPVPDGDTGTNMFLTLKTAIENVDKRKPNTLRDFGKAICEGALIGGRGNSGVIFSQILKGFFEVIDNVEEIDKKTLALTLQNATKVAYLAVIKPAEGTILTVMRSMAQACLEYGEEDDVIEVLTYIVEEGKRTLKKTPEMLPILKQAGVVDAGGQGLVYLFEGGLKAIRGERIEEKSVEIQEEHIKGEVLEYKFDTVLLLYLKDFPRDIIRRDLEQFGDSIVVADADELTKIHIHSNEPNKVIEYMLDKGDIREAHIENMQLQTDEFTRTNEPKKVSKIENRFDFSIVAVAQGDGFKNLLESLGVEAIAEGGQTMNPSIQDVLLTIKRCSKDKVVVFPNNSNAVLAVQEAKKISDKEVEIIPTKNPAEAIPIILSFNAEKSLEENIENAKEVLNRLHTIEITYSVRETHLNGIDIQENDVIGFFDGEIINKGKNPEETFIELLKIEREKLEGYEFVSIYYGKNVEKSAADSLIHFLQDEFPQLEFDLVYGGQLYYFYLATVE